MTTAWRLLELQHQLKTLHDGADLISQKAALSTVADGLYSTKAPLEDRLSALRVSVQELGSFVHESMTQIDTTSKSISKVLSQHPQDISTEFKDLQKDRDFLRTINDLRSLCDDHAVPLQDPSTAVDDLRKLIYRLRNMHHSN